MNDKKIELISAKGAMGVTEFALLYFPESPPETAYKRMWVWICLLYTSDAADD